LHKRKGGEKKRGHPFWSQMGGGKRRGAPAGDLKKKKGAFPFPAICQLKKEGGWLLGEEKVRGRNGPVREKSGAVVLLQKKKRRKKERKTVLFGVVEKGGTGGRKREGKKKNPTSLSCAEKKEEKRRKRGSPALSESGWGEGRKGDIPYFGPEKKGKLPVRSGRKKKQWRGCSGKKGRRRRPPRVGGKKKSKKKGTAVVPTKRKEFGVRKRGRGYFRYRRGKGKKKKKGEKRVVVRLGLYRKKKKGGGEPTQDTETKTTEGRGRNRCPVAREEMKRAAVKGGKNGLLFIPAEKERKKAHRCQKIEQEDGRGLPLVSGKKKGGGKTAGHCCGPKGKKEKN